MEEDISGGRCHGDSTIPVLLSLFAALAPVGGVARGHFAAYGSVIEPAAAEPLDLMAHSMALSPALTPGKVFRVATRRWLGPAASADSIVKVTVRDAESRVVRVIESERDLAAFRTLWAGLAEADPGASPPPSPWYKLQMQYIRSGGRTENASWFYFPGGTIKLLAIVRAAWIAPLYRTPAPAAFEALLRGDPL